MDETSNDKQYIFDNIYNCLKELEQRYGHDIQWHERPDAERMFYAVRYVKGLFSHRDYTTSGDSRWTYMDIMTHIRDSMVTAGPDHKKVVAEWSGKKRVMTWAKFLPWFCNKTKQRVDAEKIALFCTLIGNDWPIEQDFSYEIVRGEDAIYEAYAIGPHSCMQGEEYVRFYGDEDKVGLVKVYQRGRYIARALVWESDRHGTQLDRVYTTGIDCDIVREWLLDVTDWGKAGDGDKTVTMENTGEIWGYPYMDSFCYTDDFSANPIVLSNYGGDYTLQSTEGDPPDIRRCNSCNRLVHEDDSYYSEYDGDNYCEDCYREHYPSCYECGRDWHRGMMTDRDGDSFCTDCYYERYETYCEECDGYFNSDEGATPTEYSMLHGMTLCEKCLDKLDAKLAAEESEEETTEGVN